MSIRTDVVIKGLISATVSLAYTNHNTVSGCKCGVHKSNQFQLCHMEYKILQEHFSLHQTGNGAG